MTKGEETQKRLIAEQADARTDNGWWLAWVTIINVAMATYAIKTIYIPLLSVFV
jgi:hypothetical protein